MQEAANKMALTEKCARGGGCYDVLTTGPARSGCLKWSLLSIEMATSEHNSFKTSPRGLQQP